MERCPEIIFDFWQSGKSLSSKSFDIGMQFLLASVLMKKRAMPLFL